MPFYNIASWISYFYKIKLAKTSKTLDFYKNAAVTKSSIPDLLGRVAAVLKRLQLLVRRLERLDQVLVLKRVRESLLVHFVFRYQQYLLDFFWHSTYTLP
jgi:hypothetical protein